MSLNFGRSGQTRLMRHLHSQHFLGDPFSQSKLDYARNLIAGRILRPDKHDVSRMDLVARLVGRRASASADSPPPVLEEATRRAVARKLTALAGKSRGALRTPAAPAAPVLDNLNLLKRLVGLTDLEVAILTFALACRDRDMTTLLAPIECDTLRAVATIVAAATAQPVTAVERVLGSGGRLITTGLLLYRSMGDLGDRLELDHRLVDVLPRDGLAASELLEQFLPVAQPPTLDIADFEHLGAAIDLARRILGAALSGQRPGINTLIVGPTGTGKSELARILAAAVSVPLFVAGREDDEGESPTARERLTSLMLGNRILAGSHGLLLFDEMEDLFDTNVLTLLQGTRRDGPRMSKQWFNRLLETNRAPTIWISNDVSGVDPAFLRRFSYVIEVPAFTTSQRRRAWVHHLGTDDVLSTNDVDALAQRFAASPAEIGSAVTATRLALGGLVDRPTLEAVLKPADKILRGRSRRHQEPLPEAYDASLVNTPVDLERLASRLSTWIPSESPGISLCLYGPSGTGKSAYARHLAQRLDRPLIVRRASDLLSAWLGESEQKIAAAFAAAREEGAVLLFDEADSFLQDRRGARHAWEITQTNEFLQQLEVFPGIVACTTNLFENLDQAALRRFAFKVPFLYLTAHAAGKLFRRTLRTLGTDETVPQAIDQAIGAIANLTPGDFTAVTRRLQSLGQTPTPPTLLDELRIELRAKGSAPKQIGFGG